MLVRPGTSQGEQSRVLGSNQPPSVQTFVVNVGSKQQIAGKVLQMSQPSELSMALGITKQPTFQRKKTVGARPEPMPAIERVFRRAND